MKCNPGPRQLPASRNSNLWSHPNHHLGRFYFLSSECINPLTLALGARRDGVPTAQRETWRGKTGRSGLGATEQASRLTATAEQAKGTRHTSAPALSTFQTMLFQGCKVTAQDSAHSGVPQGALCPPALCRLPVHLVLSSTDTSESAPTLLQWVGVETPL